jgi:hypothetical protein
MNLTPYCSTMLPPSNESIVLEEAVDLSSDRLLMNEYAIKNNSWMRCRSRKYALKLI